MKTPSSTVGCMAEGFEDDCEELIQRCLQSDTLNYKVFCNIWKDMQFACIFQARSSGAEIAEFSEDVVHIAKRYMVGNTVNFEETVAGLFLVYSLVHLQPYKQFAPLRLVPKDLEAVHLIEEVARKEKRYDVLFILGSLLIDGPVQYQMTEREYGIEVQLRKKFGEVAPSNSAPRGVLLRNNKEVDLLRELAGLGRRYTDAKAAIHGSKEPVKTLNYMSETVIGELETSLKQLISGERVTDPEDDDNASDSISAIKKRAMQNTVGGMRHLITHADRKKTKESPIKSELKSKGGKIKTGSPTKIPTNSPVKRKPTRAKQTAKRSKKIPKKVESSTSESDISTQNSYEDTSSDDYTGVDDCATIDEVLKKMKRKECFIGKEATPRISSAVNKKRKEFPVTVRTGDKDSFVEIEILDANKDGKEVVVDNFKTKLLSNEECIEDDIIMIDKSNRPEEASVVEDPVENSDSPEGPIVAHLKRYHLKSKFSKLGMLPLAGFSEAPDKNVKSYKNNK